LRHNIKTTFGRDFVTTLWHEHRHLRLNRAGNIDHLVGGGHLEIKLDMRQFDKPSDVLIPECDGDPRANEP